MEDEMDKESCARCADLRDALAEIYDLSIWTEDYCIEVQKIAERALEAFDADER